MNALEHYGNPDVARTYFQNVRVPGNCVPAEMGFNWLRQIYTSPPYKDKVLVDLGCGPGTSLKVLSELRFGSYYGIDGSQAMLDIAEMYLQDTPCKLTRCDMSEVFTLKKVDSSVDVVSICSVLNSIKNPFFALEESARVLKRNGYLLCNFVVNDTNTTITFIEPDGMVSYTHSSREVSDFFRKNKLHVVTMDQLPPMLIAKAVSTETLFLCVKQ
jgi:ubiquinone/menaquinone biosynthesis C-methylase UbiE